MVCGDITMLFHNLFTELIGRSETIEPVETRTLTRRG